MDMGIVLFLWTVSRGVKWVGLDGFKVDIIGIGI